MTHDNIMICPDGVPLMRKSRKDEHSAEMVTG